MDPESREAFKFECILRLLRLSEERVFKHFRVGTGPIVDPLYDASLYWVKIQIVEAIGYDSPLWKNRRQKLEKLKRDLQAQGILFQVPTPLQRWVNTQARKWAYLKEES